MSHTNVEHLLKNAKTVAVVGISDNPARPSHEIAVYLERHGYAVIPVNPLLTEWKGKTCYPDLLSVPEKIDIVDIFRKSEFVPEIVDQAIRVNAGAVWMQFGVVHEEAAKKAAAAGLFVVMDECIKIEHAALL